MLVAKLQALTARVKTAVILWGLAVAESVENDVAADPETILTVANVVPPSLKSTVPQPMAGPLAGVTVALNVTEFPYMDGFSVVVMTVVVDT